MGLKLLICKVMIGCCLLSLCKFVNSDANPFSAISSIFRSIDGLNNVPNPINYRNNSQSSYVAKKYDVPEIKVFRIGDKLFVQHTSLNGAQRCLRLSQNDQLSVSVTDLFDFPKCFNMQHIATGEGIFGIYKLPSGYYMALIEKTEVAEAFGDFNVRKLVNLRVLKVYGTTLSEENDQDEIANIKALQKALYRYALYCSYGSYDITRSLQANQNMLSAGMAKSWKNADDRFFWNHNVLAELIESDCHDDWIVPVSNIWIASDKLMEVNGTSYSLTLLSRRSRHRQGPRYIKRGSNLCGDVANFVETEQIVQSSSGGISSFIQIRGSVPLFWRQPETWHLKPEILPAPNLEMNSIAVKSHIVDMAANYLSQPEKAEFSSSPSITMVNLIDKKSFQGTLGRWLYTCMQQVQRGGIRTFASLEKAATARRPDQTKQSGYWSLTAIRDALGISPVTPKASVPQPLARNPNEAEAGLELPTSQVDDGSGESAELMEAVYAQRADALPSRVERDSSLKNRTLTSVSDHLISFDSDDVEHIRANSAFTAESMWMRSKQSKGRRAGEGVTAGGGKVGGKNVVAGTLKNALLRLIWFDYHKKCKGANVNAMQELYALVQPSLEPRNGFFCVKPSGQEMAKNDVSAADFDRISHQHSIIRTNCVDCLDRTNVVQTVIGRWALLRQLGALGAFGAVERNATPSPFARDAMALPYEEAELTFRRIWADNGDSMSLLYAGTKALKRDVTRLGKRTKQGAFDDGVNSAMRYYINNYKDPARQRSVDILLGYIDGLGVRKGIRRYAKSLLRGKEKGFGNKRVEASSGSVPQGKSSKEDGAPTVASDGRSNSSEDVATVPAVSERLNTELESAIQNLTAVLQIADYEYLLDEYSQKIDKVLEDVLEHLDTASIVDESDSGDDVSESIPQESLQKSDTASVVGNHIVREQRQWLKKLKSYQKYIVLFISVAAFNLISLLLFDNPI